MPHMFATEIGDLFASDVGDVGEDGLVDRLSARTNPRNRQR